MLNMNIKVLQYIIRKLVLIVQRECYICSIIWVASQCKVINCTTQEASVPSYTDL